MLIAVLETQYHNEWVELLSQWGWGIWVLVAGFVVALFVKWDKR